MNNPICKCCSDDCSPSLSEKGFCFYCEKAIHFERNRIINLLKEEVNWQGFECKFPATLCGHIISKIERNSQSNEEAKS